MYLLRQLKQFTIGREILVQLYRATTESVLCASRFQSDMAAPPRTRRDNPHSEHRFPVSSSRKDVVKQCLEFGDNRVVMRNAGRTVGCELSSLEMFVTISGYRS